MIIQYAISRVSLYACVVVLLLSCTGTPTPSISHTPSATGSPDQSDLRAIYATLNNGGGRVLVIDPKLSSVRIYAFRGGPGAAAGHNHVLSARQFLGYLYLPDKGVTNARFDLEFRLDQLAIDEPADRANLGEAFASVPSSGAIRRTRDHMLGEENLQADRFPLVRIHSTHVAGAVPKLAVEVQVELHGIIKAILVPLTVAGLPDHVSASGALVIRQSDFGIQPYSVLGGFLAVQDEVVVEFTLVGN